MADQDNMPISQLTVQRSLLHMYSIGVAANNKEIGSDILYVTPIEAVMMQNGELISNPFKQSTQGEDADGNTYNTSVNTDAAIKCTWKRDSNRRTSPDVRRGERVMIWRYADRDEYMWESLGQDDHLRKLETVVLGISGTPDESADGTESSKGYYIEMSSHKGMITIQTSTENGEKTTTAIQMNGMGGMITIVDGNGNNFHINTGETIVEMQNSDGTLVQLKQQDIFMKAPRNISVKAENDISMEAGNNITIKAGNAAKIETGSNIVLKPGGKLLVDGQANFLNTVEFQEEVTMHEKLTAHGITSSEPIEGPSDTI